MGRKSKNTMDKYVTHGNTVYFVRKKVEYQKITLEEKLQLFQTGKDQDLILNESYEENQWKFQRDKNEFTITFQFECFEEEFRDALKTYLLLLHIEAAHVLRNVYETYRFILRTYQESQGFDSEYLPVFTETIGSYKKKRKQELWRVVKFLEFLDSTRYQSYVRLLKHSMERVPWIPRDLPDYYSVCLFSEIISDYYARCGKEEKMYFLSLFVWWFLSTKIPLRPKEVFLLEKDWLYEKHGTYYLHIERCKQKVPNTVHSYITEFELDEGTHQFLQEVIALQEEIYDSKYICSTVANNLLLYSENFFKEGKERFTPNDVRKILCRFQEEVVQGKYGYTLVDKGERKQRNEIERISLGDTRHLAFMNLMQLGYNPLLIAQIGGHTTVETQIGYYTHFDTFSTSKTFALKEVIERNMTQAKFLNSSDTQILSIMQTSQLQCTLNPLKIRQYPTVLEGHGKCSSKCFPLECIDEGCLYCKNFIATQDISEYYLNQLQKTNEEKIGDLKKTISALLRETCLDEINAKILEQSHKSIIGLFNQNAIIKTYQLIREERSRKNYGRK